MRVLAVADTDSYLKWSLATLAGMPEGWSRRQVVLRNVVMPSPSQVTAAGGAEVEVVGLRGLWSLLARERPDVLLLACTGPVIRTLSRWPLLRGPDRPVLVSGLPGVSYPASARALRLRRSCDLFVLHSHRERDAFLAVAATEAPGIEVGLARLPFLPEPGDAAGAGDGPLVFAAQAQVPVRRSDREAVLRALAAAPPAVVKLRAAAGEQQTHHERDPYDRLWADLVARGEVEPDAVRFRTGAMRDVLAGARGLATVSSTAALEAIALGLPVLVVDDFGVSAELVNLVFTGSGCLGSLAGLARGELHRPEAEWGIDNYFHPAADSDWLLRLRALVERRAARGLPRPRPAATTSAAGTLRQYARLSLTPAVGERWRAAGRTARGRLPRRRGG